MTEIERLPVPAPSLSLADLVVARRASRAALRARAEAHARLTSVLLEGDVQTSKVFEIDHLTRECMTGQAMLVRWGATLSSGDAFLADEMKFFTDIARIGKGEVIADTIATYCRESRGH